MGTEIGVLVGARLSDADQQPAAAAAAVEERLREFDRRLTRFAADSELSRLNRESSEEVRASSLMRAWVRAGVWAAERTGGLVDPTLLPQIEAAGYAASRNGIASAALEPALTAAPPRRPGRPARHAGWKLVVVDDERGTVRRPPGLRLDSGGTGKGLAADLAGASLDAYARYVVDCGGDILVGGRLPESEPVEVEIRDPLRGEPADSLLISRGAVATSGLDARLWQLPDGSYAHHLIDPASGKPAWTGLVCAAARAPTVLEADALAKAALLSGPRGARSYLEEHGGLVIRDDGAVERFGPLHEPPRIRIPRAESREPPSAPEPGRPRTRPG